MSTSLTVLTIPASTSNAFTVYWVAGVHRQGRIDVDVPVDTQDADCVAELSATQHLLEDLEVCSKDRRGKSLNITFSCSGFGKLVQGKSPKKHLAPYALFLRTRFLEATLQTSRSSAFVNHVRADANVSPLLVTGPRPSSILLRGDEAIGVTAHAFENFCIRFGRTSPSDAWGELQAAAVHSAPRPGACTSDEMLEHGSAVRIYDAFNGARLVVVPGNPMPMLVTAYWHHSAQSNYQKFCQSAA